MSNPPPRPSCIKHYADIQEPDNSHYKGSDELLSIGSPFGRVFGFARLGIHHLHALQPGDGVGFIPGTGISHTFINNTDADVRLLVVGDTNRDDNKCFYPLHAERNQAIGDFLWADAPPQPLGPHDGLPNKVRGT